MTQENQSTSEPPSKVIKISGSGCILTYLQILFAVQATEHLAAHQTEQATRDAVVAAGIFAFILARYAKRSIQARLDRSTPG